ncbi:outer membrane protein assembly factor BamB [Runella defluvii]|uniref:Outer membrane protein assembly factor BamB n=1 Tax=Runella defluvii TaxID=370973 RepID=A0A7W5ZGU3_9BACT|nr:PQQ-binding-like beta-propeller repeat protein [Runella defluvii]MBB3836320.1 outer membrane protein assembly factor BamB [Runella defluvii]
MKAHFHLRTIMPYFFIIGLISVWSCKTADTPTPTPTPGTTTKSSAKDITKFSFAALSPAVDATIDATAKTISATVPAATDLTKLVPTITISDKATISPATGIAQDFSKEVSYTVTAEDASTQVYKVTVKKDAVVGTGSNFLYVGEFGGLTAYDPATGKQLWKFSTNSKDVRTDLYLLDGIVYFGSDENKMYAVDAKTGTKKWEFQTVGAPVSSPVVEKGILYFGGGSGDNKVYALDAASGAKKWEFSVASVIQSSPTVADGIVYITSFSDKTLFALDASTGSLKWKYASSDSKGGVCVANGLVIVSDNNNKGLLALEAATGAVKWRAVGGSLFVGSVTVSNDIVYASNYDKATLHALDIKTGAEKWKFATTLSGSFQSSPITGNGLVYFVGGDDYLYALDAATGAKKWSLNSFKQFLGPVFANGILYASSTNINGTYDPRIHALDAATGARKIAMGTNTTDSRTNPALWIDGKVYMSSSSGAVQ